MLPRYHNTAINKYSQPLGIYKSVIDKKGLSDILKQIFCSFDIKGYCA